MERLEELAEKCRKSKKFSTGFLLTINGHIVYGGIGKYLDKDERGLIPKDIYDEIVKRKTLIEVSVAPICHIYHYDISQAVELAIQEVDEFNKIK